MARRPKDLPKTSSLALIEDASLAEETRRRYLNYALSVITSRALPDVRDGLKPVQRRILYTMDRELHLRSDARYRKSAAIVGEVMGKFHPHGDTAIYDALVRLAQDFTMRAPLVDGRGNFGSPDGDSAAAMRYTEAKLRPLAVELLEELGKQTVSFRPNYDGTRDEPTVLPARFPHLLVNGSQGIAVGMATSIPPHNLGEVIDACVALIDDRNLSVKQLLKFVKGPDFPTGGELSCSKQELEQVYTQGQGALRLRGTWTVEQSGKGPLLLVIQSIPYLVERGSVVEKIADLITSRRLPQALDVRDESTDVCRIVCELRPEADPALVAAFLQKHTPLAVNVQVNLTALVPVEGSDVAAPQRLDLVSMLQHFLRFRMRVIERRLRYELEELRRRIHILEGFETVFDVLDETIAIIRRSEGRKDAAGKLMQRFKLDEEQVNAILDLRLYKLARLEINLIRQELKEKRAAAQKLDALLRNEGKRWKLMRDELEGLKEKFATRRLTKVVGVQEETKIDPEAFIIEEDAMAVITQQGWVRRQQRIKDVASTRVREGDALLEIVAGSTRSTLMFFTSTGSCYSCRLVDLPATSGYGSPIQTFFRLGDGEKLVSVFGTDPRFLEVPPPGEDSSLVEAPLAFALTRSGMAFAFSLRAFRDPSTRNGRRFCRLGEEDEVVSVGLLPPKSLVACVSARGKAILCPESELPRVAGPAKGVRFLKLDEGDHVVAGRSLSKREGPLELQLESGKTTQLRYDASASTSRGGKGFALIKRGRVVQALLSPQVPEFPST